MKRRLNRAYDHMTMPDRCSDRIEQALRQELKKQQTMKPSAEREKTVYTRMVAPEGKGRNVWVTAAAAVLVVLMLSVGGVGFLLHLPQGFLPDTAATAPSVTEFIPPETTESGESQAVSTASILSAGDLMMHKPVIQAGQGEDGYQFGSIFWYAAGSVMAADCAVANLETTLASDGEYPYGGAPNFNCPDDIVNAAKAAGFDLLLNANNHSYDTGSQGMDRTIQVIRDRGLDTLGIVASEDERPYLVKQINGINIGMICYTYETDDRPETVALNGILVDNADKNRINTFDYAHLDAFYEEMAGQLAQMRGDGAEAILVYLHWGEEYQLTPNEDQTGIAQRLCDLGVDVIIGSHPHVVQPMELLESTADPNHKTVVLYSLGNAVSNQRQGNVASVDTAHTEDGVLFTVTFARYADGSVGLEGLDVVPAWVYLRDTGTGREYNILPLYMDRSALWTDEFGFSERDAATARDSYNRTMEILGDGLAECRAWLDQRRDERNRTSEPETTPADHYAAATSWPAAEVEALAVKIRQAVLDEDWYALHPYLTGGYQLGDLPLDNADRFADHMALYGVQENFRKALEAESCREMFCNYDDGIMLGNAGQIWLAETDGALKIAAINGMVAQQPQYEYEQMEDGTICILRYLGSGENVTVPGSIGGKTVTRLGHFGRTGTGAFQNCGTVKRVTIPDGVTLIDDNAFSGCTNLEIVTVGTGVTGVGSCAFEACPRLNAVCFSADAPDGGNYIFSESEAVTVYHDDGADGWQDTWEGRPTAIQGMVRYKGTRLFEELFMPLAEGTVGNSQREFQDAAENLGFAIIEENGVWLIYDPEDQGSHLNAKPLFGESGFAIDSLGYAVTVDGITRHVKVTGMLAGGREYFTGSSIFAGGGTPVIAPDDFRDYLNSDPNAEALDREAAHEQLAEILGGSGTFLSYDGPTTLEAYFAQDMAEGVSGGVSHCAVLDLDGNGTKEVLLRMVIGENEDAGTLVLYANGAYISGQVLYYREMYQLKADGTFLWSGGASNSGIGRLELSGGQLVTRNIHWSMAEVNGAEFTMVYRKDEGLHASEAEFDQLLDQQEAKPDIQWIAYPEEVRTAVAEVQTGTDVSDQDAVRELMYRFGEAYFAGDRDAMTALLADGLAGLQPGVMQKQNGVVLVTCKGIPKGKIMDADCKVSLEVLEEGQDSYSYLSMTLVKKTGGWYVKDYGLEK